MSVISLRALFGLFGICLLANLDPVVSFPPFSFAASRLKSIPSHQVHASKSARANRLCFLSAPRRLPLPILQSNVALSLRLVAPTLRFEFQLSVRALNKVQRVCIPHSLVIPCLVSPCPLPFSFSFSFSFLSLSLPFSLTRAISLRRHARIPDSTAGLSVRRCRDANKINPTS